MDFYLQHELMGDHFVQAGKAEEAREAYEQALELNPTASWIAAKRALLTYPPAEVHDPMARALYLFLPFYTPQDPKRAEELLYCLDRNLECGVFARITLLIDDETPLPRDDLRLDIIRLDHRPTYLDWIRVSRHICPGHISVFSNSDIYFDDTIALLFEIFSIDHQAFIALSRFDKSGESTIPHPDPHFSQDIWAFIPMANNDRVLKPNFAIPVGTPRCDNKIAYLFSVHGYCVYNPFPFVRSVHVHESELRYYDKTEDRRICGGVAMVHPSRELTKPAQLGVQVWSRRSIEYSSVTLNRTLERWDKERGRPFVGHNGDWQYPAITEKHASDLMRCFLPNEPAHYEAAYLGFPFATLIDLLVQLGPEHPRTRALRKRLDSLIPQLRCYRRVVTVAQHVRAKQFASMFAEVGVTDLFWSHCVLHEKSWTEAPGLRLHPFPLYPVQQVPRDEADVSRPRRWLFSFVGARSNDIYLTRSRSLIIETLGSDPRGKVTARDRWHYEDVVYGHQILSRDRKKKALIDGQYSVEYISIMDDSLFTLCPSGTGPNSIRLWEAVLNGSVPVILSDSWLPPGPPELWDEASVRSPETPEAIRDLPERLSALAANVELMRHKRKMLAKLAQRYGPANFVHDVLPIVRASS